MVNLADLQEIALAVAQAREVSDVLRSIAQGLANEPDIALARIWLIEPGDRCETCALREACPDQTSCLHLVASAGRSIVDPDDEWSSTEGRFARFPLGVRKVGRIGATGAATLLTLEDGDDGWIVDRAWAQAEGLRCFAGQPLVFRGETLGVLAVFSRADVGTEQLSWLRTFADHAAVSIANARAFEELADLRQQLERENTYLREEMRSVQAHGGIVGASAPVKDLLRRIETVAPTEATVLIQGESGTGKELIACAIHQQSRRSDGANVRVNCASIPKELFESEFFGHVAGAFTGATKNRCGRFQVADGGTLFLDEVGEIPIDLQGKLLRALQEGQFSRVGEDDEISVDVRVVAATNRDLRKEVDEGRFREDLYYRLTVFPIDVPPLRERLDDVPDLARHFLALSAQSILGEGHGLRLTSEHVAALKAYDWPGNVRELQNVIERGVITSRDGALQIEVPNVRHRPKDSVAAVEERRLYSDAELKELERSNLQAVLDHARWKISGAGGAAEFLGVRPATLSSRLKAMGIERPRSGSE